MTKVKGFDELNEFRIRIVNWNQNYIREKFSQIINIDILSLTITQDIQSLKTTKEQLINILRLVIKELNKRILALEVLKLEVQSFCNSDERTKLHEISKCLENNSEQKKFLKLILKKDEKQEDLKKKPLKELLDYINEHVNARQRAIVNLIMMNNQYSEQIEEFIKDLEIIEFELVIEQKPCEAVKVQFDTRLKGGLFLAAISGLLALLMFKYYKVEEKVTNVLTSIIPSPPYGINILSSFYSKISNTR